MQLQNMTLSGYTDRNIFLVFSKDTPGAGTVAAFANRRLLYEYLVKYPGHIVWRTRSGGYKSLTGYLQLRNLLADYGAITLEIIPAPGQKSTLIEVIKAPLIRR